MKKFPSFAAVVGAWLCAFGFILPGIIAFLISSLLAVFIDEDTGVFTLAFFAANIFAFCRLV